MTFMTHRRAALSVALAVTLPGLANALPRVIALGDSEVEASPETTDGWETLFNGEDLTGWTPKIQGHALGDDPMKTFRVKDGCIQVSYDEYEGFERRFGHLFYEHTYESYDLKLEYRFTGDQIEGGPGWAYRNSGIMVHGQDPRTMREDQDFPVSIEVQLLGGSGKGERTTGNLCTPGTNVVMNEELVERHCTNAKSETYHGERWVTAEVQVRGSGAIRHLIEGEVVLEYSAAQLDPRDGDAKGWIKRQDGVKLLSRGTLSLQSESHPCEFRNIRIRPIPNPAPAKDRNSDQAGDRDGDKEG